MTTPDRYDFQLVAGDSMAIPLSFCDPEDDNKPVDVSGWTLWLTLKQSSHQPDTDAVLQKKVVLPQEASSGEYDFILEPEDTKGLRAISYEFDMQLVSADRQDVVTMLKGRFTLKQGTTEAY